MGLPRELVDHIIATLHDDLPALKACSLTCRAMFASTRYLIHQTLCLTPRNGESVVTREEKMKLRIREQGHQDVQLRFLSYMGEHGLLQYTRKIYIYNSPPVGEFYIGVFTPDTLLPHVHHFQSMDRVHAITIERFDSRAWEGHYKTCFAHFYLTLTSLTLHRPSCSPEDFLVFVLQFPNLENLSIEWWNECCGSPTSRPAAPAAPTILREHLRLANLDGGWPSIADSLRENGFTFRSVELDGSFSYHGQEALDANASSIQSLTIISGINGARWL